MTKTVATTERNGDTVLHAHGCTHLRRRHADDIEGTEQTVAQAIADHHAALGEDDIPEDERSYIGVAPCLKGQP